MDMGKTQGDAPDLRFEFGKNWSRFLTLVNDVRIDEAERSLKEMLAVDGLEGMSFLDIGSGSGLFSLCAMRLGASRVHSFDYDARSVACTRELRKRYFPDSPRWSVEHGSVLDSNYLFSLGQFDVVYSWGVLHHTGALWTALENCAPLVRPGGMLFVAIYNKQRVFTPIWTAIKKTYVKSPPPVRMAMLAVYIAYFVAGALIFDVLQLKNPLRRYRARKQQRGMSVLYDWIDWLGGYPFETAQPEEVFHLFRKRGFILENLKTCYGSNSLNELVFRKAG